MKRKQVNYYIDNTGKEADQYLPKQLWEERWLGFYHQMANDLYFKMQSEVEIRLNET